MYKCSICNISYYTKNALKDHISRKHDKCANQFECSICKKRLSRKDSLKRHMKQHTKKRQKKWQTFVFYIFISCHTSFVWIIYITKVMVYQNNLISKHCFYVNQYCV